MEQLINSIVTGEIFELSPPGSRLLGSSFESYLMSACETAPNVHPSTERQQVHDFSNESALWVGSFIGADHDPTDFLNQIGKSEA